ncbi:17629_t:CDS:2 [Funneliformis caledonium]|uniref:Multiple inositol polyphosphate phosphatase 1 n=1 Tax=Funneliformis caledonium TaxID=1117310 RepID=A0A9N8Z8B1_9GLOM|nr:17629_t:CDS:2 [Funneliformis caledonium]
MQFTYYIVYSIFVFGLFISNNPALCVLYKYTRDYLINNLFFIEPAETAFSLDVNPISYPDKCELKQLNLISRHGSRYPNPNDIINFEKLEKVFSNVSAAKEWYKNPFPMRKNNQLVKRGEIEPFFDGLQCRKRYKKFWDGVKYDPEVIKFQSTQTSRAGASLMSFSEGLFNGYGPLDACKSQPIYYWNLPLEQDSTLSMFTSCRRWNETVNTNNPLRNEQIYLYGNKTLAPIAKRISKDYHISPPLDPLLVPFMFTNCQYWLTVYNRTDAWCSLLSPKELLLSRYYFEMDFYYRLSYGSPLNLRIGCRYITELVNGVEGYLYGNSSVIADLKFSHSFSMTMILTTLGLFKNEYPLTGNLTFEQIQNFEYSEFRIIPWSSTIYFEIYKCSGNNVYMRILLDFKPLYIPGCGEYCEWNKFKMILGDKIGCDYEKLCAYP